MTSLSQLHRRSWQDLDVRRLALGLAAAPFPSIPLGYWVLSSMAGVPLDVPSLSSDLVRLAFIAVPAEIWAIAFGSLYLIISPRRSGAITRVDCLFLGGLAAALYPPLLAGIALAMPGTRPFATIGLPLSAPAGLLIVPLGVLGGWIFWRVGVYPAQPKVLNVATVFD
jgi:hypothetical protein